jgi:hypothetical protein
MQAISNWKSGNAIYRIKLDHSFHRSLGSVNIISSFICSCEKVPGHLWWTWNQLRVHVDINWLVNHVCRCFITCAESADGQRDAWTLTLWVGDCPILNIKGTWAINWSEMHVCGLIDIHIQITYGFVCGIEEKFMESVKM